MDWNIVEGTLNGWNYLDEATVLGLGVVFGTLAYKIREYKYLRARAMYERGYLKEEPTFWNTGRLLKEYRKKAIPRGLKIMVDSDLPPLECSIEYNRRMEAEAKE